MKIEQILILHLYNTQKISLQGIGIFKLDPSISISEPTNEKIVFPNEAVSFEYDPKTTEDASLIDAIVYHTKKIKPLATSDLDSFLMTGKELLTLNNPFVLNGIGSIIKTQNGELKFVQEHVIPSKAQKLKTPANIKSGAASTVNSTAVFNKVKKPLLVIVLISILSLTVFSLAKFFLNKKSERKSVGQTQKPIVDSPEILKPADITKKSELVTAPQVIADNPHTFKIVFFETTNNGEAITKLNEIIGFGHSPVMYKSGLIFKVAMAFNLPLADTLHIRDSLDQFYSLGKGFVEVE